MNTRIQLYQTKKKKKWPWVVAVLILLVLGGGFYFSYVAGYLPWKEMTSEQTTPLPEDEETPAPVDDEEQQDDSEPVSQPEPEPEPEPEEEPEEPLVEIDRSGAKGYEGNEVLPTTPTYVKGVLMASKQYPLPEDYAPGESKDARSAFQEMAAASQLEGITLVAFSTFRSFERQQELYARYVANDGQEAADRYSARPGYSEHQSGLAFDIGEQNFEEHFARESFGETAAGIWVAANAHHYGFILRYPNGKEKITGYMYEPWHFRFVGKEVATAVFESGLTLEEYIEQP